MSSACAPALLFRALSAQVFWLSEERYINPSFQSPVDRWTSVFGGFMFISSVAAKLPTHKSCRPRRDPRSVRTAASDGKGVIHSQTPPDKDGKKGRRGILRTLLCCFGGGDSSKASKGSGNSEWRGSPPLGPGSPRYLLPPVLHQDMHKKCMVIDLDETLVHSSFKPINNADFVVPVEIDGTVHQVYVLKRPYVDDFLRRMGELYECILFTASLAKYADPVADLLDQWGVFRCRLFRESCVFHRGNYVKDLNKLGRDLQKVVIVDNSPASYIFHPDNAVPVASWFNDMSDTEMLDLIPFFENLSKADNVYTMLCNSNHPYNSTNSNANHVSS